MIRPRRNDDVGFGEPLQFVNTEGRVETSWVRERSALDKPRRLSEKLAERYL